MADLSSNIDFSVLLDFTQNKIIVTDTGNYPVGVELTLTGIVKVTQPDGVSVQGTFIPTPDIVWGGTDLTQATKELRLSANGKPQQGTYVVVYQIYDGVDVTTRTKIFQLAYTKPLQKIQENFDVFTPVLQVTDATNYDVSNFTAAVTRQWNAQIGSLYTKTGTNQSLDLAISGVYYDADYTIDLSADVISTSVSDPYLSIKEHFTSQLITEANTPPSTDDLLGYVNAIKEKVEAEAPCGDDCCKGQCDYIYAFTLYRHIRDRICKHQTVGLYDYIQQLLNIYYGYVKEYENLDVPIMPYALGDCEGGTTAPGFPITVKLRSGTLNPCHNPLQIVYVNHSTPTLSYGDSLYIDMNLTLPVIGYNAVVDQTTGIVYSLGTTDGKVGTPTGDLCVPGFPISVKLANGNPCSQTPTTVFIEHNSPTFNVGDILFADSEKTIPVTGMTQVVDLVSGLIYNIGFTTGVVGAATGTDCIPGYPIFVKLSNASPCSAAVSTVYTNHSGETFNVGDILYTDVTKIVPVTGYTLVVSESTGLVHSLDAATGQVGAATGADCITFVSFTNRPS